MERHMAANGKTSLLVYTATQAARNRFAIETMIGAARRNGVELIPVRSDGAIDTDALPGEDAYSAARRAMDLPSISLCVDGGRENQCYIELDDGRIFDKSNLSFAIPRGPFGMLHAHLDDMGVPSFNPSGFAAVANSKIATLRMASRLGIRFKPVRAVRDIVSMAGQIHYPIVAKPDDGHGGMGVSLLECDSDAYPLIGGRRDGVTLLQDVADSHGEDMRVYVLDGEIIAAMLRTGDGFLSNYTKGGKADIVDIDTLDPYIAESVGKIIDEFGSFFGGVDFLRDGDGWVLGEIEDAVGCRMLYDKTDIDPFSMFIDFVCRRIDGD